ncbi:unnamed protein product [Prorocentrum cordatum]|uniref:Uncharacterized protein n=1 Tax=Prorocentrum cordatum TaxID=2364126 RepID=A0ABN9VP04_9DINO|nr:unnamed protein product [Polarella glacialis]
MPEPLLKMLGAGHGLLRDPAALDPKLARRGCDFGRALSELFDAGVVELRLIADARAANLRFVEPAYTELASPEALAAIEYDGPDMIRFCSGDVEVCFYQCELPAWARRYFTLPAIKSQCLPAAMRGQMGLARGTSELKFRFRVVPMGWSWAVHLIQQGHLHVMKRALQSGRWVLDKRPGVDLLQEGAKVLYIDNFAVASVDQGRGERAVQLMREALAELGVASAIEASDGSKAELLGCELDRSTGRWRIKPKRIWRLMGALDYLLEVKGRKVTGHEIERVLGHIVAACMLRREALAMLSACYTFAETSGLKRQPLWASAQQELLWVRSLLPCIVSEMGKPWSQTVTAYDASPWGCGVVETEWGPEEVASHGRLSERARFRGPLAAAGAPRDRTMEAEVAQAPDAALILTGRVSEFPEVRSRALAEATWRVVGCGRWRRREAIHCLEAASVCWAARRIAKRARRHGQRHLVLGDSMSADADGSGADSAAHLEFRVRPSQRGQQTVPLGAAHDARPGPTERRGDAEVRRQVVQDRELLCPRLPRLAAEKVRLKTQTIYLGVLRALLAWPRLGCPPDWSREDWDCTLVEFVEWLFAKGGAAATAKRVGPALLWGDPRLAVGSLRATFPVLQQALKGWVQQRPEFARPPLPWVAVAAAARELLDLNTGMAASGIMIMFETYTRPSELLALSTDHAVLPLPGESGAARWLTFVIRAQEALVPSKTFDISVPLDLERQRWLARCVEVVVRRRGSGSSLLGLVCADFAAAFKTVLKGVGASVLQGTLYSLRHGGASHDRSMGARSLAAAQQRGGWRAFRSATRCEKHGRLGLEPQKLEPTRLAAMRRRSAGIELAFEKYFGLR